MRKLIMASVIGSVSSLSAAATCQYPLDATDADYQGWEQFPYVSLQSFGYISESTANPVTGSLGIRNMVAVSHDAVQAVMASLPMASPQVTSSCRRRELWRWSLLLTIFSSFSLTPPTTISAWDSRQATILATLLTSIW